MQMGQVGSSLSTLRVVVLRLANYCDPPEPKNGHTDSTDTKKAIKDASVDVSSKEKGNEMKNGWNDGEKKALKDKDGSFGAEPEPESDDEEDSNNTSDIEDSDFTYDLSNGALSPTNELEEKNSLLVLRNCRIGWNNNNLLHGVNLWLNRGSMYCLTGVVGSGKSTFLMALMGEANMHTNANDMKKPMTINDYRGNELKTSYVSQVAWIRNWTIRDNILFFREYDENKYYK